jgi:hypothetical protein
MWHLRRLMAERGAVRHDRAAAALAERGVVLSREQVYRLVVRTPERSAWHACRAVRHPGLRSR